MRKIFIILTFLMIESLPLIVSGEKKDGTIEIKVNGEKMCSDDVNCGQDSTDLSTVDSDGKKVSQIPKFLYGTTTISRFASSIAYIPYICIHTIETSSGQGSPATTCSKKKRRKRRKVKSVMNARKIDLEKKGMDQLDASQSTQLASDILTSDNKRDMRVLNNVYSLTTVTFTFTLPNPTATASMSLHCTPLQVAVNFCG